MSGDESVSVYVYFLFSLELHVRSVSLGLLCLNHSPLRKVHIDIIYYDTAGIVESAIQADYHIIYFSSIHEDPFRDQNECNKHRSYPVSDYQIGSVSTSPECCEVLVGIACGMERWSESGVADSLVGRQYDTTRTSVLYSHCSTKSQTNGGQIDPGNLHRQPRFR